MPLRAADSAWAVTVMSSTGSAEVWAADWANDGREQGEPWQPSQAGRNETYTKSP